MKNIPSSSHQEIDREVIERKDEINVSERCIYKVPMKLRDVNWKAYSPQMVSIGPFYHGKNHLQAMEHHKLRYLKTFLDKTKLSKEACLEIVRMQEKVVLSCYAENIDYSLDYFVNMILVDGSFIIEFLLRNYSSQFRDENEHEIFQPWMFGALSDDMMLLENQLPFFILEKLYDLICFSRPEEKPSFCLLIHRFFKYRMPTQELPHHISITRIRHFVHFIHCCCQNNVRNESYGNYNYPPTVTELHESGIKFEKEVCCSIFDIKFVNGILKIPQLTIEGWTENLFRNLIAFEQCHWTNGCIILDYCYLFNGLINTPKDVELLINAGIIKCRIGSSGDVLALFNNICKNAVTFPSFCYCNLCTDLDEYCKGTLQRLKRDYVSTLKRDYCNTPWKVLSVIAALILLVLTFIQTVCSVISVISP